LVSSILAPLSAGGSIVCTPGFSPDTFAHWVEDFRPTWYTAVPAIHQAILELFERKAFNPGKTPLRFIRTIASPIAEPIMDRLEAAFRIPVVQAYGLTEALCIACTPLNPYRRKSNSVGPPFCPEVAVMGDDGSLLAQGETGEIVVRGPHVFKGYENNPEANQKAFARGWFRTGDVGRFDDEGYLYLTGRLKDIINRGGQKVAPQEVEAVLTAHPAVRDACVFSVFHSRLGEAVAAAVVLKENAAVQERDLRQFVSSRLIPFKVPQQILFAASIPRNHLGKVQRSAVAEHFAGLLQRPFVAPESEVEVALAEIWSEVLRVSSVGRDDDFFSLGGDSLLAMQIVSRVKDRLEFDLPLRTLFQNPILQDLAAAVVQARSAEPDDAELETLLAEVEGLTDEEIREMLKTDGKEN
jgi:acyl-CoA synthetase (AMP-forming)/AMP-acid ligase II/acyl carrier protein